MKKRTLRIISALLILALMCLCLSGCGGAKAASELSFSAGNSISQLRALDGKSVTIVGYMATMSPPDGKYIYLMNLPYQSCPFCVPNTTQLANTIVFAVLIVVLLVRPAGLLGKYVPEKV